MEFEIEHDSNSAGRSCIKYSVVMLEPTTKAHEAQTHALGSHDRSPHERLDRGFRLTPNRITIIARDRAPRVGAYSAIRGSVISFGSPSINRCRLAVIGSRAKRTTASASVATGMNSPIDSGDSAVINVRESSRLLVSLDVRKCHLSQTLYFTDSV